MESSTTPHNTPADGASGSRPNPSAVLAVLLVGTFLAPLDGSIVNIALPAIQTHLHARVTSVTWVADAYLLTVATLLLSMGRLGDVWGLRKLYVWGLVIFGAGSLTCAFSPTLLALVAARILQAVGASMLLAAGPAIVAHTFPPNRRGAALGVISLGVAAGLTAGPALGGVLVGMFGWPSIFLINVPISVIAAVIARAVLGEYETIKERFDLLGAVLAGGALLGLVGGLTEMGTYGLGSIKIMAALLLSLLLGFAFLWWERRASEPMVDLTLFRSHRFSAGLAAALLSYMGMFSITFAMPFYLLRARGMEATRAGLILTAMPFAMAVLAPTAGRLSDRIGNRLLSPGGLLVLALGLGVMSTLTLGSSLWLVAGCLFLAGAGMALFQSPNTSAVLATVPRTRSGIASALIAEARNVGMALGIAVAATVIASRMGPFAPALTQSGVLRAPADIRLVDGMAMAMRVGVGLALLGAGLSWFFRDERRD